MANRPVGRKKHITDDGKGISTSHSGLGSGPVGVPRQTSSAGKRAAVGGGLSLPVIIILVVIFMMRGGGTEQTYDTSSSSSSSSGQSSYSQSQGYGYSASVPSSLVSDQKPDTSVASGSRDKRTQIIGDGKDTVTVMVYMCGTDLESKYGMATNDLREMMGATYGDNVNVIVYTGGCSGWKNSSVSSSVNQIWQVKGGQLVNLVRDDGSKAMTDHNTLSSFIKYCTANFPANRNELIFWDHGGGSVSGYGYDEKYKGSGSMRLGDIGKALSDGGTTFDFIGFDACLMATAETALLLDKYADYMIASEETEPGIGWYYTNWLTKLGQDTSVSTIDLCRNIIDDYTSACAAQCRGQKTTLSLTDLAEFANTVPAKLGAFSRSVSGLIENENYRTVSDARYTTREFAQSSKIDQVDLVHLAMNMGTSEGSELAEAIRSAVKYNRTSTDMTNAYGISVYFPYKRTSYVDPACSEYDAIGFDDDYAKCIRQFASLEVSGQAAAGGTSSPVSTLFGTLSGSGVSTNDLVSSLLSGGFDLISGLDSSNTSFLSDRAMSAEETDTYISHNSFDPTALVWNNGAISLSEEQWELVHDLDLNVFYFTGDGYIDLGLDNTITFDENNDLVCENDSTWLSVNGQPVAYYRTDTTVTDDDTVISGYIPALVNGERMKLIVVFNDAQPYGYIAGASEDYRDGQTETTAKNVTELNAGDEIRFICDFYGQDGGFSDIDYIGAPHIYDGNEVLSNTEIDSGKMVISYRFTDIYNNEYWTPTVKR